MFITNQKVKFLSIKNFAQRNVRDRELVQLWFRALKGSKPEFQALPSNKLKSNNKQKKADFNRLYTELKNSTKQPIATSYSKMDEVKLVTIGLASANRIRQWAEKTLPNGKVIGEVTNANTLHHKTFKPQKGGLFCERIFGPLKDFECACGTKKTKEFLSLQQNAKTLGIGNNTSSTSLSQDKNLENSNISSINSSYTNLGSGQPFSFPTGGSKNYKRFYCSKCDVEYTWSVIRRYQLGYIKLNAPVTHVWYVKGNPSYISLLLDMKKKDLEYVIYCTETLTIENSLKASATADEFSIGVESAKEIYELWQKVATKNSSNQGLPEIATSTSISTNTNESIITTEGKTARKETQLLSQNKNSSKKHKNMFYYNSYYNKNVITVFKQTKSFNLKPFNSPGVKSKFSYGHSKKVNTSLLTELKAKSNRDTSIEYSLQVKSTLKNFYKSLFQAAVCKDSSRVNNLSNLNHSNNLAAKLNKSFCSTKSLQNVGVSIGAFNFPGLKSQELSGTEAKISGVSNNFNPTYFKSFNTLYSLVALKQKRYLDSLMIKMFKSFSAPWFGFQAWKPNLTSLADGVDKQSFENNVHSSAFKMLVNNYSIFSKSICAAKTKMTFNQVKSSLVEDSQILNTNHYPDLQPVAANYFQTVLKNLYALSYTTGTTETTLRVNTLFASLHDKIQNSFESSASQKSSLLATDGFQAWKPTKQSVEPLPSELLNKHDYLIKYLVGCLKKRNTIPIQLQHTKLVTKLTNIQLLILKAISGQNSRLGKDLAAQHSLQLAESVFKVNPSAFYGVKSCNTLLFKLLALRNCLDSKNLQKNKKASTRIAFILNRNVNTNLTKIGEKSTDVKHTNKYFMSKKSLLALVKIIYLQKTLVTDPKLTKLFSPTQNTGESSDVELNFLQAYNVEAWNGVKSELLKLICIKKLSKPYTLSLLKVFFINRIACLIKKSRILNFTEAFANHKENLEVEDFNKIKKHYFNKCDLVLFKKSQLKAANHNQYAKQASFSTINSDRSKMNLQIRLRALVPKQSLGRLGFQAWKPKLGNLTSEAWKPPYGYLLSGTKSRPNHLTLNKLNGKIKNWTFLLSSSYSLLNSLSANLVEQSTVHLTTTKTSQQAFNKSKSLYIVNNLYCLSHREMWEQEKDWYFFALYFFNAPDLDDISVPVYEYRNYDFSLLNSLFSPSAQQEINSLNVSESTLEVQQSLAPSTTEPKSRLTRLLEKQDKPNLHITYSGAGIIQTLLAEFDYFELKKMDKQNRILLYDLNRYIKKLKRSLAVGILGKNITGSLNFLTARNENNLNIDTLDNSANSSALAGLQKSQENLSFAKNYSLLKKEFKEVCKQRDLLIRRTKLIRKIFRNYLGFSKSTAMEVYNSTNEQTRSADSQGPGFRTNVNNLTSMILTVLPVLPPDLRPIIKMGSQIAASDLNRLYQRVIYRNDRLKKFLNDTATNGSYEMKYAQRLLQEAVDNLIQNGKSGVVPEKDARGRALKSLSELLKGKQGRFRQYLLGKRVDYSGRSVIVVGPKLKLHECGIPKEMALELYLPFLIKRILTQNLARTVVGAKALIKNNKPLAWSLLREIMKTCPVLLNRAPTLHRLGFQAFQPKLVDGRAILLHPLSCPAFNADFDGDQMAVHVPITPEARTEAWKLMLSRNNLLSPATGEPLVLPSQDMVLGCYYLTTNSNTRTQKYEKGYGMYFDSFNDVLRAYYDGIVATHSIVWVKWTGTYANYNGGQHQGEQPIEIRINNYGSAYVIYSKTHLTLAPNIKLSLNQNQLNGFRINNNTTEQTYLTSNSLEMHWPESNQKQNFSPLRNSNYSNNTILVNQIIRTTPGKILFNALIQKSWNG